jgi:hypothetical protein
MRRDILAGALLVNALPHTVTGVAGRRGLTPLGGEDSSPGLNLVWAAMNVVGGAVVLASAPWRGLSEADAADRRRSVQLGVAVMGSFGLVYEVARARGR